ncbi:hypothetical protein QN277_004920 [Acacia crassicarpa]|uniref:RRM domain-containing protein n=1 Tax=Acacia crassicarpa TaxID=499986 RepID=A0AAE1IVE5_9FABA|nr:hypothetical protein QN277_004920 [Acacia crassicarpa]
MDFDEYEYLEKTVENPELQQKEKTNGSDGTVKVEERDHSWSSKHKATEKLDDVDRHSKKLKSGDDPHGYDNHKVRGSSRHRSSSRDGDKEEKHSRVRDRHREHHRDRERGKRDRGSEGEREMERDHSRRSRSISERDRERSRDRDYRDRERSRDKDCRDRERGRESREWDRDSRRHKEKKEEAAEPEADPERDQRTVFAYQISLKADERDVYEFFSRAGKVRDVRLIMDRNSRRSKGVGYIEFYDVMSVPMAIALSSQPLLGQPVMVKPSEAEKNLVQSTTSVSSESTGFMGPYSGGARRLYVGNLHFSITEADIRVVFEAFGQVELVQLPLDETGHCKGFGFVQFVRLEDARNAQSLNGQLEIGGRTIKVSAVLDQTGMQEVGGNTGDFDDDGGGGMSLNACSRALLMQKLDRSGTGSGITGSLGNSAANNTGLNLPATEHAGAASVGSLLVSPIASGPSAAGFPGGSLQIPTAAATFPTIDTIGAPSECLLLKNMFDPKDEKEPDFDLDIKEDVEAECSKFGTLTHVYIDKNTAGFVYLRFENTQAAINAQRSLHGRWFAGKMITASFMVPQLYEDKFKDSR